MSRGSGGGLVAGRVVAPRGEGSRWTICTACSLSARVADSCLPQFAYANLVTISPRSLRASSTAATSNSRCRVLFTPISILSKSMKTAIFSFCSIIDSLNPAEGRLDRPVQRAWRAGGPPAATVAVGGGASADIVKGERILIASTGGREIKRRRVRAQEADRA